MSRRARARKLAGRSETTADEEIVSPLRGCGKTFEQIKFCVRTPGFRPGLNCAAPLGAGFPRTAILVRIVDSAECARMVLRACGDSPPTTRTAPFNAKGAVAGEERALATRATFSLPRVLLLWGALRCASKCRGRLRLRRSRGCRRVCGLRGKCGPRRHILRRRGLQARSE
jgi:hypothetical protein